MRLRSIALRAFLTVVFTIVGLHAQAVNNPLQPGQYLVTESDNSVTIDGAMMYYWIWVPPTYDSTGTTNWPVIILPPGTGQTVDGNVTADGSVSWLDAYWALPGYCNSSSASTVPSLTDRFVVIATVTTRYDFTQAATWPVFDADMVAMATGIDHAIARYKIDRSRVCLAGEDAGAMCAVKLAELRPTTFAAMFLVNCNGPDYQRYSVKLDSLTTCSVSHIPTLVTNSTDSGVYEGADFARAQELVDQVNKCSNTTFWQAAGNSAQNIEQSVWLDAATYNWFLNYSTAGTSVRPASWSHPAPASAMERSGPEQLFTIDGRVCRDSRSLNGELHSVNRSGVFVTRSQGVCKLIVQ